MEYVDGGSLRDVVLVLHSCYSVLTVCCAVVTLLLHCCYTVFTLFLHCWYTVVTLLLHYCYTIVTLLLHYRHSAYPAHPAYSALHQIKRDGPLTERQVAVVLGEVLKGLVTPL
jgi:hypothetical protein